MRSWHKLLSLDAAYTEKLNLTDQDGIIKYLAVLLAHSGDSWFWLIGLIFMWIFGNSLWKDIALFMVFGIFVTAIVVFAIKFTVRRQRPSGDWGNIYRKTDPHSFPSGHAARAMMLAFLGLGLGPLWLGLVLIVWAPLVMLARVALGVHYLSDIIVGGFLGIILGIILLQFAPRFFEIFPNLLFT